MWRLVNSFKYQILDRLIYDNNKDFSCLIAFWLALFLKFQLENI